MFKNIFFIAVLAITFSSCEYVLKNKDEVLAFQKREITYDDFTYEYDSFNQTVYLDTNKKRMNGHFTVKYKDKIAEEFEVKTGLLNGFLKTYYPEGSISKEKNYKNGILHGASVFYTKTGNVYKEATYSNGKLSNDMVGYDNFGNVISIKKIVDDIEYHHMYKDGKMIISEFKKNINGTVYDLIVRYDSFENISLVLGKRDYQESSKIIYVFDSQFNLTDTVNLEKDPSKARYYLNILNIPE